MRLGRIGFVLLVAVACRSGARESQTAAKTGCPAADIVIKNETWGTENRASWVAECRGRSFVCTSDATDVRCREEMLTASAPDAPSGGTPKRAAKRVPAPTGGAGFEFGTTSAGAQKVCSANGGTWESVDQNSGTCFGASSEFGSDVAVRIDFCAELACKITVVAQPDARWIAALGELKDRLTTKFGEPFETAAAIPADCRTEAEFVRCLEGGLRLRTTWSWASGERVNLLTGKSPKGDGDPTISVEHTRPASATGASKP